MQAVSVVLDGPGAVPRLETRALPEPGPGEALVRVEACGLCGSDLFLQDGGFRNRFPVVPGHEAAGTVLALGPAEDGEQAPVSVGDRVALYYIANDPASPWASSGRENLGPAVRRMGVDVDGALAEAVIRPVRTLIRPAAPVPAPELAVLTDALATPYHALTAVAGMASGELVTVIGIGGIGSNAVQVAAVLGASVIAVGRSARSRELAERLGAAAVLESGPDLADRHRGLEPEGADVVLVCSDAPGLFRVAVDLCAPNGRVVAVAATHDPLDVSPVDLISKELALLGSRGFTAADIRAVQNLYLAGRLELSHLLGDVRPLAAAPDAFDALRRGGGNASRILIDPSMTS